MTRTRTSSHGPAFSLIEMLIALTLSMLIIAVVAMAFRAVEDSYRKVLQARTTNSLLIAGYLGSMSELDSWLAHDDPNVSSGAGTELRAVGGTFAPLTLDAAAWRFRPDQPRWWHHSGARTRSTTGNSPAAHHRVSPTGTNPANADARFLPDLQVRIWNAGLLPLSHAYLPPGLPHGWLTSGGGTTDDFRQAFKRDVRWHNDAPQINVEPSGGFNLEGWRPKQRWAWGSFNDGPGDLRWGLEVLLSPRPGWTGLNDATLSLASETNNTPLWRSHWNLVNLRHNTTNTDDIRQYPLPTQLAHGSSPVLRSPDDERLIAGFGVRRSIDTTGFVCLIDIEVQDSETGQGSVLRFPAIGSTLRGARMLPRPDGRGQDRTP